MLAERRGRAMGTDVQIVLAARDHRFLDAAMAEIDDLERRWSRFIADSEVSQLNRHSGRPMIVSRPTYELVAVAIEGWRATEGRFDPTTHDALVAAGYDRSFAEITGTVATTHRPEPAPGAHGIHLDLALRAVTLPPGVRLDMGGIGKGVAADTITASLLGRGAAGACVSIGGDVRVRGISPFGAGWPITLSLPRGETRTIELIDGAACTSTRTRRCWSTARGPAHHLIDPSTGRPIDNTLATITVCASDAARAEILTKSAFVLGMEAAVPYLADLGVDAVLVDDHDRVVEVGRTRPCEPAGDQAIPRFCP